ncbi:MAG TPA: NfeD family protein [Anaerolineales bacterium]|nr:NfeD family protein [Anaerolineales bacterium]
MNFVDLLWQTITNPNVVYILLIAGVWAVALAITTPGTGVAEAAAVVLLGLALLGLTRLPVNFIGLALIFLSLVLYVLEIKATSHGAFLITGVLTLAGGSLFLFRTDETAVRVSVGLVVATVLVTAGFFTIALRLGLQMRRKPPLQNLDAVVGAMGEAKTDILKEGAVLVNDELWTAEADELIPAGTPVQIVKRTGLRVKVVRVGPAAKT